MVSVSAKKVKKKFHACVPLNEHRLLMLVSWNGEQTVFYISLMKSLFGKSTEQTISICVYCSLPMLVAPRKYHLKSKLSNRKYIVSCRNLEKIASHVLE
jgi:hypothetical protein